MFNSLWGKVWRKVYGDVEANINETLNWEAWLKQRSQAEYVVVLCVDAFVSSKVTRGVKQLSQAKLHKEINE